MVRQIEAAQNSSGGRRQGCFVMAPESALPQAELPSFAGPESKCLDGPGEIGSRPSETTGA